MSRRIGSALSLPELRCKIDEAAGIDGRAVHAGGRSILDSFEQALGMDGKALALSRYVVGKCGNMSSATLMFVLERVLISRQPIAIGFAIAFGPGLAAERLRFRMAA